jgi:hypothetical protein
MADAALLSELRRVRRELQRAHELCRGFDLTDLAKTYAAAVARVEQTIRDAEGRA